MKIREVEELLGITSKNIRFYEKEGLLCPKRNLGNGYREYSLKDIHRLKEIKLFRKLGVSIEHIKLLHEEKILLKDVLEKQIENLEKDINSLNSAKQLCGEIENSNVGFKEVNIEEWLCRITTLEKNGIEFEDIYNDEIIKFLPDKFKTEYYETIIKNGQIDDVLLKKIINYIEELYANQNDTETILKTILKNVDDSEREKILSIIKENNKELCSSISKDIFDFEDIVNVDSKKVKMVLDKFQKDSIVKASMGASPKVNEYLEKLFPNINFPKTRQRIGSIPIGEIVNIHNEIIEAING